MSWREEVFGPLMERTMENAQVNHLAQNYDLSRDSRLAQAIVEYTNTVLDAEEKRRQVQRVRPGELLLRTHRGPLVSPIRTREDIARVITGERWDRVRRDILERCEASYRELFPDASPAQLTRFLRTLWQHTRYQPMAPILVTLLADNESSILRHRPPSIYEAFMAFHGRRMERVLSEAYIQDGLLSFVELQWIFLVFGNYRYGPNGNEKYATCRW